MNIADTGPEELFSRLNAQEADPHHIDAARRALEEALLFQLRAVAQGLFADQLLRGVPPDTDDWWCQYASLHEPLASPEDEFAPLREVQERAFSASLTMPWEEAETLFQTVRSHLAALLLQRAFEVRRDAPAFGAFRTAFLQQTAMRRVRAIAPATVNEIRIRVYGGEVDLWQQGRINRQLRDLGSSLRYWVDGGRKHRISESRASIGETASDNLTPLRFVLGDASPVSAIGKISLIDLEREFACSPYMKRSPGYAEGATLVIRRVVPSVLSCFLDPIGHEFWHAATGACASGEGLCSWHAVLREDICRFCRMPRNFGSIAFEFSRAFGFSTAWLKALELYPLGEAPDELPLQRMLLKLCDDELLVRKNMNYYCPLFEEGRRWHVA